MVLVGGSCHVVSLHGADLMMFILFVFIFVWAGWGIAGALLGYYHGHFVIIVCPDIFFVVHSYCDFFWQGGLPP